MRIPEHVCVSHDLSNCCVLKIYDDDITMIKIRQDFIGDLNYSRLYDPRSSDKRGQFNSEIVNSPNELNIVIEIHYIRDCEW